jgi:hypothetical protein
VINRATYGNCTNFILAPKKFHLDEQISHFLM